MEEFKISNRLQMVAGIISPGNTVADIGTDHGYLPIYLVKQGITDKVIAMDVRKRPLEKARINTANYGVKEKVELRLSDGLDKLAQGEADTITICGMGGKLIQSILEKGRNKYNSQTQLIVSPQSEIREFRQYLMDNEFGIVDEHMLKEEGQFYFIIECRSDNVTAEKFNHNDDKILCETWLRYGKILLDSKNPCLYEYIEKERQVTASLIDKVKGLNSTEEAVLCRIAQLEFDMTCIRRAIQFYQ